MKIFAVLFALFLSTIVYSQSNDNELTQVQAGTATLVNGKTLIRLDENIISQYAYSDSVKNRYFVSLTPIGDCGLVKLGEKGNKSFTVAIAGAGSNSGSFDYIVFLKYHIIQLNQNIKPVKFTPPASATGK